MKFPFNIEVETVATGEKKKITVQKEDLPKGFKSGPKAIEYLSIAFPSPNFNWQIIL